jgi:hypothetical protein
MHGGELATWSIADGKLTKLGSATLADIAEGDIVEAMAMSSLGHGNWVDRDHLVVALLDRDVVMVTASAITRLSVPPVKAFEVAKPADPDGDLEKANSAGVGLDAEGLQVTAKGEVFWSQCAWGQPYDGFLCKTWVHAQLWPTPARTESTGPVTPRSWSWTTSPAGFKTTVIDGKAVACSGPGSKSTIKAGKPDDSDEYIEDVHWVSAQPPRLLVSYGHPGLADVSPERWTLHDGCKPAVLASGSIAEPGPAGLWIGSATRDEGVIGPSTLYRNDKAIGQLPDHARTLLRPTK